MSGDRGFAGITRRAAVKPLIAAIEGFAVAGGLEVALACDLIVAAEGAKLGIPEVKRSLIAAGGGLLRLPRTLPRNIAMELALTGEPISAERGYRAGAGQPADRASRGAASGARARRTDRAERAAGARWRASGSCRSQSIGPRPSSSPARNRDRCRP